MTFSTVDWATEPFCIHWHFDFLLVHGSLSDSSVLSSLLVSAEHFFSYLFEKAGFAFGGLDQAPMDGFDEAIAFVVSQWSHCDL